MIWVLLVSAVASPLQPSGTALVKPLAEFQGAKTKSAAKGCTQPLVRKEWRTLTRPEKLHYIAAVKCLQGKPAQLRAEFTGVRSRYDDFVASHISRTGWVHFSGLFHPFHRLMVAQYESELRSECNYNGSQPYWDWTLDAKNEKAWINSPVFSPVDGFGGNGDYVDSSEDSDVANRIPGKTGGGCVKDGPFTEDQYIVSIGPGLYTNPNPHCLRRDFAPAFAVSKCSGSDIDWIQSAEDFAEFDKRAQGGVIIPRMTYHPGAHFGVGGELGEMSNQFSSPGDPIFYLHHANVDRLWAEWQARDLKRRTKDIAGPVFQFAAPFDFFDDSRQSWQVTLDTPMRTDGLLPHDMAVEEVMDIQGGYLCYRYDHF
ncbi:hypothetical protein GE09DRAFT_1046195 [Coniochaeta sp. 2T2.1]|nr:hypothetical protein GE09DRAFT_1046195 [Coniochaeta sp. 2T2.1]